LYIEKVKEKTFAWSVLHTKIRETAPNGNGTRV